MREKNSMINKNFKTFKQDDLKKKEKEEKAFWTAMLKFSLFSFFWFTFFTKLIYFVRLKCIFLPSKIYVLRQ